MDKMKKIAGLCMLLLLFGNVKAQELANNTDNADLMRSNGKLYVVVAVVLTILIGLFFYLFTLDRKISRMEKKEGII